MPYFYDSYAVLAYFAGHPGYRRYFRGEAGFLTILNLMEIYYTTLREHGEEWAERVLSATAPLLRDFTLEDMREAMKLRLRLRKEGRSLSYADALGYHLASRHGVRFLTGDPAFKQLENVEYIK